MADKLNELDAEDHSDQPMKPTYINLPCLRCGKGVDILEQTSQWGVLCEGCIAEGNRIHNQVERSRIISAHWEKICPKIYLDTEIEKLPYPKLTEKVLAWSDPHKGLNLWGAVRTGKTRTMYLAVKQAHFMGKRVRVFAPSEFAQSLERKDFKTASWIRQLTFDYDIVAFDDIDKCKFTRAQEDKFFALLDGRLVSGKPVFMTGNTHGGKLKLMFHHGDAIIERIREFCHSIHFPPTKDKKI